MTTPGPYRAIVLDLFDTIVHWQPNRLPKVEWRGKTFPSTLPILEPILAEGLGFPLDVERWRETYVAVIDEISAEREATAVEISCQERFERALRRIGAAADHAEELARRLARAHMAEVRAVTEAPEANREAIRTLARHHRMAVLSNFDDAVAGREIVGDTGVADLFEVVVISADLDVRKPHPRIYHRVLDAMGLAPTEALFVGDTPREDVLGAQAVGMPVVWLSEPKGGRYPENVPPPDFTIPNLAALPALLGL